MGLLKLEREEEAYRELYKEFKVEIKVKGADDTLILRKERVPLNVRIR
jgi:hypothetical protein